MRTNLWKLAVRSGLAAITVGALLAPALVTSPSEATAAPQARKVHKPKAHKHSVHRHKHKHKKKSGSVATTPAPAPAPPPAPATPTWQPKLTTYSVAPNLRTVSAPNTYFPVVGGRTVSDQKNYSSQHLGTDLVAPCDSPVVAANPGTVQVETSTKWANPYVVRVASKPGGLVTSTAYLSSVTVQDGQIVAAGQQVGTVGARSTKEGCRTYFSVKNAGSWVNPSPWLNTYVGNPSPVGSLFGDPGFVLASFNVLGASHTKDDSRFAPAEQRTPKEFQLLQQYGVDVVGLQEFQESQKAQFLQLAGDTFGVYNFVGPRGNEDSENAIIWRKSTFELVQGDTYDVPYFNGNIRHMPVVLLRNRSTGRTAYFMNTHNPADVRGPAQQWRDEAVGIERQKIIDLRTTGRPVFLTGDFNDKQEAFCPLTADMLTISANSVPSMTCAYPSQTSIDWIFGAGPMRFSWFVRDKTPQQTDLSDHPLVMAKAHLQY